jgi:hypothetical protein
MSYLGREPNTTGIADVASASFTGNGSTTAYTLPIEVGNEASVIVSIDGVRQHTSAYTVSGAVLTFTAAPPNGGAIETVVIATDLEIGTVALNSVGIPELNVSDGTNGQALMTNGSGTLNFGNVDALPTQSGNTSLFLTTDGSSASWGAVPAGSPVGGGTNKVFYENDQSVTVNYTLTANKNAMTAAPVVVNSGITVTVPSGARWVIV